MIRSAIVMTPIVGRLPDIGGIPSRALSHARQFHFNGDGFNVLTLIGTQGANSIFWASTSNGSGVISLINALPGRIWTISQILRIPGQRAVLSSNTDLQAIIRVSDGETVGIHPPNIVAGKNPLQEGVDEDLDAAETYQIGVLT